MPVIGVIPTQSNLAPGNHVGNLPNQANYYAFDHYGTEHSWLSNYYPADHKPYLTPSGAFMASPGPYGTYDMGGNVWQWSDSSHAVERDFPNRFGVDSEYIEGHYITGGSWQSPWEEPYTEGNFSLLHKGLDGLDSHNTGAFYLDQSVTAATVGFRVVHIQ